MQSLDGTCMLTSRQDAGHKSVLRSMNWNTQYIWYYRMITKEYNGLMITKHFQASRNDEPGLIFYSWKTSCFILYSSITTMRKKKQKKEKQNKNNPPPQEKIWQFSKFIDKKVTYNKTYTDNHSLKQWLLHLIQHCAQHAIHSTEFIDAIVTWWEEECSWMDPQRCEMEAAVYSQNLFKGQVPIPSTSEQLLRPC